MEIYLASADDLRRVWRSWEEPPACPAGPKNDAGGSCRKQRRSRDRGQPDRERQARPAGFDGAAASRGRRRQRKRSSSLDRRPAPCPCQRPEADPLQLYFAFSVWRSGATVFTGMTFISSSPPPARQPPAVCRGGRGQGKEILNAKRLVNAQHIRHPLQRLCSGTSEKHQQA